MEFGVLALASHLSHRLLGALQTLCTSAAQVCQKHFAKVLDTPEAKAVRTQSQAALWLWRVHNEVRASRELGPGRSIPTCINKSLACGCIVVAVPSLFSVRVLPS